MRAPHQGSYLLDGLFWHWCHLVSIAGLLSGGFLFILAFAWLLIRWLEIWKILLNVNSEFYDDLLQYQSCDLLGTAKL